MLNCLLTSRKVIFRIICTALLLAGLTWEYTEGDAAEKKRPAQSFRSLSAFCDSDQKIPEGSLISLEADETIHCALTIPSHFELNGNAHTITLTEDATILVPRSRNVTFRDTRYFFTSTSIEAAAPLGENYLFKFEGSENVFFKNNSVVVDIPTRPISQEELQSNAPLGRVVTIFRWQGVNSYVNLLGNQFISKGMYTTRMIEGNESPFSKRHWTISNNDIRGFHGVLYSRHCEFCTISRNFLHLNSFTNIVVSGKNIDIGHNNIFSSGAGSDGDGITVNDAKNINVHDNTISYGSCYAIWFHDTAESVVVERNKINAGITTGINFENPTNPNNVNFRKVIVRDNLFNNNFHHGIGVTGASDFRLEGNYFIRNDYFIPPPSEELFTNENVIATENYYMEASIPSFSPNLSFLKLLPELRIN